MLILHLATTVVLPIAILIAVGWWMDRTFKLDVVTLARLNFWVFVPALAFVKLVQAPIAADLGLIILFGVAQVGILGLAGWLAGCLPALRARRRLLVLGSFAYNIGNYGIPMATFAFGQRWLGTVIVLLTVQNIAVFTLGPLVLGSGAGWRKTVMGLGRVPVVIAVAAALAVRFTGVGIPEPLMSALGSLSDGLIPVALLTLGVQMARTPLLGGAATASLLVLRLIAAPALSWVLASLMGLSGDVRTVLVVCAALPVAVNVFVLCSEYGHDSEDAARAILWTTVIATVVLPLLIALLPAVAP